MSEEPLIAIFVDYENLAIGARDSKWRTINIDLILKRLLEKGRIVYKRAYCDWSQYRGDVREFHARGIELVDIPRSKMSGKNSADIRMVVDALDLCYTKSHVDTFVIVSGDSDFSPLVSKLRENNKTVIGVGVKNSTGDIFISNCDEFIFYDDLVREQRRRRSEAEPRAASTRNPSDTPTAKPRSGKTAGAPAAKPAGDPEKAVELLLETVDAMLADQGGEGAVWGSSVKQTIKRRLPQFSERFHGFRSFNALIEEAGRRGLLVLERDDKSGGYLVRPGAAVADAGGDEA
jgi:uncharacterized protein (TIGR00288 family)